MKYTVVMTGASRGIGRVAAERMLRADPDVHLAVIARDPAGAGTAADLEHRITLVPADLASSASVRTAARKLHELLDTGRLPPLRGFVGNAGIQYTDNLTAGAEGYEATFTVNVLANHLLIRLLLDRFVAPARIVITVSDTHFGDLRHNMGMVPGPRWSTPHSLAAPGSFARPTTTAAGRTAYSTSKLAAIYLVHEYARRLPAGIDIVSYNPGFVPGTGLARNADPVSRFAMRYILPIMTITPLAVSRTTAGRRLADLALGRIAFTNGGYIDRDRAARSSGESYAPDRERELWAAAEELCGF
ncbi:SDR family NAD(P)-dependent oxidoreductase [Nocardia carnea]|uniref:SDR family NAD(P)-dependent oxidoreductase n=1 Tax=Nocardia carnea TaxID=37328 RepID=UPI00245601E1|nr:SDR family NAD(P)-dependent oxidoreductase [Nocardia carnea]